MINRLGLSAVAFAATINVGLAADLQKTPQQTQWKEWALGLGKSGYRVSQGTSTVIDSAKCRKIVEVFGSCLGNTIASPYIVPELPIAGAAVDSAYGRPLTTKGLTGAPSNMLYRLSDRDASVIIVSVPPQAAYWGFQSYVFSRKASDYPQGSDAHHTVTPDPNRYELFASLGNDLNHRVLAGRLGPAWGQGTVVYITTSNQQLADSLVNDARAHGLDSNRIFVESVGSNVITGTNGEADDMVGLIRYDLPKDAKAGQDWRSNIKNNVMVFRVTAAPSAPVVRYGPPVYTPKESASEDTYTASLDELVTVLHDWLEAKEGRPILASDMNANAQYDETGASKGWVGATCIATGQNCLADTQDADSSRLGFVGQINSTQTLFVAGVNHAASGNADDVSLTVYDMNTDTGIVSASQSNPVSVGFEAGGLTGSAEQVLKDLGLYDQASEQLRKDLPFLYAARLSRDCPKTIRFCIALNTRDGLPLHDMAAVVQRAYLKPGTTTGANPEAMLTPKVIFRPAIEAK